jgi:hypothetical protein
MMFITITMYTAFTRLYNFRNYKPYHINQTEIPLELVSVLNGKKIVGL